MKKLILTFCFLALVFCFSSKAGVTVSNLITEATAAGTPAAIVTNTSPAVLIGSAYVQQPPSFSIHNSGLIATNAFLGFIDIGTDTNNFSTLSVYGPSRTNAADDVVSVGSSITIPIYMRLRLVSTNSQVVGGKAIFNTP